MTVLVTGAAGGFGRLFTQTMRADTNEEIVATARAPIDDKGIVPCDLTDPPAVHALIRQVRPTMVYHLAGTFSPEYAVNYAGNVESTRQVFDAIAGECPNARIVIIGSAAEYGAVRPDENPVAEDRPLAPMSAYGLSKAFQTQLASYYARVHDLDVVVARMFNLVAPGLSDRLFVGRLERLIERYTRGLIDTIDVGNLNHQRDYVSAPDAIAQVRSIAARGVRGQIYNVGSGFAVPIRDVLHRMLDAAGVSRESIREAIATPGGHSGYDVPVIFADMRRTRALQQ